MSLHERYPLVFSQGPAAVQHEFGWSALLDRACATIENVLLRLPEEDRQYYHMAYTKEKYGGLVLVFHSPTPPWGGDKRYPAREAGPGYDPAVCDAIEKIIKATEHESYTICESCGKPGELRMYSWCRTHCEDCFDPRAVCPEAWEGMIRIC